MKHYLHIHMCNRLLHMKQSASPSRLWSGSAGEASSQFMAELVARFQVGLQCHYTSSGKQYPGLLGPGKAIVNISGNLQVILSLHYQIHGQQPTIIRNVQHICLSTATLPLTFSSIDLPQTHHTKHFKRCPTIQQFSNSISFISLLTGAKVCQHKWHHIFFV